MIGLGGFAASAPRCYSLAVAVTSYPGTVTPLRGLLAFTEAERDVFWGREAETAELAKLTTMDGYRAGLLHGPAGAGKTSLLRAGLIPHLQDHGVVALLCRDNTSPAQALAAEFSIATNKSPRENETPVAFLARTVSEAMKGQQYLFILDDIDTALASRDDTVIGELADMFARVVTRSGGRARFLFSCDSSEIHHFSILERRTGSLFPPISRLGIEAFSPDEAAMVFERMTSISGLSTDAGFAHHVARGINHGAPVLAADLQIAATAMTALSAANAPALESIGGASELGKQWLLRSARATGDERAALRLLGQMAQGKGKAMLTPSWAARRSNLQIGFVTGALQHLADCGVLRSCPVSDEGEPRYQLAHSILAPRLRVLAAPAQASAQRAFELLGSKADSKGILSVKEWFEVSRQRIEPANEKEGAVLARTKRVAQIIGAAAIGLPIAFLILMYSCNSGRSYLDVATVDGNDRVVVRDGRPGLSMFHWLGFGDIVADTGLDARMVSSATWSDAEDEEITFDDDELRDNVAKLLDLQTGSLVEFATTGEQSSLAELVKNAESPEALAGILDVLSLIGRGQEGEQAVVAQALVDGSPAVRISALRLAAAIESRRPGSYSTLLETELGSPKADQRRLATAVVRGLPDEIARRLWSSALGSATSSEAKNELSTFVAAAAEKTSNPTRLTTMLADGETDKTNRATARAALLRLVLSKPKEAAIPLAELAANESAPERERVWALSTLFDQAVLENYDDISATLAPLPSDKSTAVKAAALPLLARIDPETTKGDLAILTESTATPVALRAAVALAWGEVVGVDRAASEGALLKIIEDRKPTVRRAAARALGKLGRTGQAKLADMAKSERLDVAAGAALGLVESARSGGSTSAAIGGIIGLWKKKGAAKRHAAEAFATLARFKPSAANTYVASAARDKDDPALHPIGVRGLCNALAGGGKRATRELLSVASNAGSAAIRRKVGECATDLRDTQPAAAIQLASKLLKDSDPGVRLEAVQTLAALARDDDAKEAVASRIGVGLSDPSRAVRIVTADAIAALGASAPTNVADRLPSVFSGAGEIEKLALLRAAEAVGGAPLVPLALTDSSDRVRSLGLRLALREKELADVALQSALTDPSQSVRQKALEELAATRNSIRPEVVLRSLSLATRDPSPQISSQAIRLFAEVGDAGQVNARLKEMLESRVDTERRAAATAARGLAMQAPTQARELLASTLRDPARDVRAQAAISVGFALAQEFTSAELGKRLRALEKRPAERIAIGAAFFLKSRGDQRDAAVGALKEVADGGPALGAMIANLTLGLIEANADGLGFLAWVAP